MSWKGKSVLFATQDGEQRDPLPFANSTANYVPTSRGFNPRRRDILSGISSLIPFRLLVDDVVVWIVLSAFFASLPFPFLFLPSTPFQWPVSPRPSPRSWFFVLLFLGTDAWTTRLFRPGQTNISNGGLPLSIDALKPCFSAKMLRFMAGNYGLGGLWCFVGSFIYHSKDKMWTGICYLKVMSREVKFAVLELL